MTECSICCSLTRLNSTEEQIVNTVGSIMPHDEIKLADDNGKTVPIGERGEVWIRGYNVMKCYWDEPKKTEEAITKDGWLKIGRCGHIREDGFLQIVGRKKDMAIRGGENIYPAEIEQLMFKHPDVAEAHVVGVPDERLGEELCAFVKLKDPSKRLEPKELQKWMDDKITRYKIPDTSFSVPNFRQRSLARCRSSNCERTLSRS